MVKFFIDESSGKSINRPGLRELLEGIKANGFDKVVFCKLDRLGRKLKDVIYLFDEFDSLKVSLVSIEEQIDTSSYTGRFIRNIFASVAELEREMIRERTLTGREEKAQEGGYLGGQAPYGYEYVNNEFIVVPEEARVVEKIFKERIEGKSLRQIANQITKEGIKTKRNGKWHANTIKQILENVFYTGRLEWEGIIARADHQSIISDLVFEKVNKGKLNEEN